MSRKEPRRVVCYAVNGTGVGHITRLLAIARWIRRYAAAMDVRLEIWFLTSSEAEGMAFADGFAAFKIPSKTIVHETGIDPRAYLALAKQWVWHTLGLLRPDLLIVDTFPRGSFGELLGALDLCRRSSFIYRPVRREVSDRPDFQAMLSLYDLIVVPEAESTMRVPANARGKLVHTGPIVSREAWELLPRDVARARLGLGDGARAVFVSAGGGGDESAEAQIERVVHALRVDATIAVVVGTGPLSRGAPLPGVTLLPGRAADYMRAFDAAVCAAGYNTFSELMFAGVPAAFLPQHKTADDQLARATLAVGRGAGALVSPAGGPDEILSAVQSLLARPEAATSARAVVPENCARVAAAELLRLIYPAVAVDEVEAMLVDERLERLRNAAPRAREADVMAVGRRLARGHAGHEWAAMDAAAALLSGRTRREVRELVGLADACAQGLPTRDFRTRADVCTAVLDHLDQLRAGDSVAAHLAVTEGRWGEGTAEDGVALALAMRHHAGPPEPSSSSFLSRK